MAVIFVYTVWKMCGIAYKVLIRIQMPAGGVRNRKKIPINLFLLLSKVRFRTKCGFPHLDRQADCIHFIQKPPDLCKSKGFFLGSFIQFSIILFILEKPICFLIFWIFFSHSTYNQIKKYTYSYNQSNCCNHCGLCSCKSCTFCSIPVSTLCKFIRIIFPTVFNY